MHQQDFNLQHPVSHTRDPETAKDAERKVTASGARKSNNQRIAWLVARYPGLTASELTNQAMTNWFAWQQMGFDKALIEVRRRLSDMNGIHVERGTKEEARIGLFKNKESIWRPRT